MTVEQIDNQIKELKEKKKKELQKQKQKALLEQRKKNAQKRKLENRVKYIIGGWCLVNQPEKTFNTLLNLKDNSLRDQDRKTLEAYKATLTQ